MKLKIKTKFLAVLLIISLLIIITVSLVHYSFEKDLTDQYTSHSIESIKYIAKKNSELADQLLTPFTERYLELAVDDISDEIHFLKIKNNNIINKEILQDSSQLRALIAKYSYLKSEQVIHFVVLNETEIVLSFDPTEENKSYLNWIERCPDIEKFIVSDKSSKGYYNFKIDGTPTAVYMNVLHVSDTKYDVVAFLNLKKYFEPTNIEKQEKLNQELIKLEEATTKFLKKSIINIGTVSSIIIIIILIICFPISLYFATTITKPICILRDEVQKIGKGDFNVQIKEQGSLEVIDLIKTFNFLGKELKEYIGNLEKEITARQKVENEIKIAAKIQLSTLPEVTSSFDTEEFSIAPLLQPATEASGDFYDFFFLPNGKLALVIADVSGKGISAAFFMALSKTVLRNMCEIEPNDPAVALSKTNDILATSNRELMFVTVFLMYYDIQTGKAEYANAGHHDALLLSQNKVKRFGKFNNSVIGFSKNLAYQKGEINLEHDDVVILYTDGITEAVSPENIQFGDRNLEKLILTNANQNIKNLSKTIIKTVREFEQNIMFDDATILILKRK